MDFPTGCTHFPQQEPLIALNDRAWVCIRTHGYPNNATYKINERVFETAVLPYLHGDWANNRLFQVHMAPHTVVYSGAEHDGTPKLPNLTVVPNWPTQGPDGGPAPYWVFGCTMGHRHLPDPHGPRVQEVYEFLTSGLLVLDRENGVPEIWVARAGDKVAVPDACHMTLYNQDEAPLTTLDFADPCRNPSDKALVKTRGPLLLIYYDHAEVTFVLNRLYVNNPPTGVRLAVTPAPEARYITVRRSGRTDLGQFLYEQLTGNPEVIGQFARLGFDIKRTSPQVRLAPVSGTIDGTLSVARPLAQAAVPSSEVYTFFLPQETAPRQTVPVHVQGDAFVKALDSRAATVKRLIALQALGRPLVLLVQGAGEWVEAAFRPTFTALVKEGHRLSVFYADDTSWKGTRPAWTKTLYSWETYLDKADAHDLTLYHNILARVDAVVIATPDVTHAALARECVRRRVPLVLVEKPFDSHHANIDALVRGMGLHPYHRAVLGLDHYMFYTAVVRSMMPAIQRHLGGALAHVAFYMTETKPIEHERERSLQYGLMLDLLPHMLALLTYFGTLHTVDDLRIGAAGQYAPLLSQDKAGCQYADLSAWYVGETYARVQFTYEDYAGNRVPCLGVVGKGLAAEVKYLEVTGINGNAVRIDLNRAKGYPVYPYDSIFFLAQPANSPSTACKVPDPYNLTRSLYILPQPQERLDRERYKRLFLDLIQGTDTVLANVLLLDEAYEIVKILERIWDALQAAKPHWRGHALGTLEAVQSDAACSHCPPMEIQA